MLTDVETVPNFYDSYLAILPMNPLSFVAMARFIPEFYSKAYACIFYAYSSLILAFLMEQMTLAGANDISKQEIFFFAIFGIAPPDFAIFNIVFFVLFDIYTWNL